MRRTAADWIADLWARLGLGRPPGEAVVRIDVDGVDLRLAESDGGSAIVVEADGGALPTDPRDRVQVVDRVMRLNLGLLVSNVAAGTLVETAPGRTIVRFVAAWPLGRGGVDGLMAVLDDVVHRAELHRAEFAETGRPRPAPVRQPDTEFDPRFIFRP